MPARIEGRSIVGGLGALLVLIGLFLRWYEPSITAWDAFEVWDVVLAAIAVGALYASFEEISGRPAVSERWYLVLGLAVLVIVASQLLNEPPAVADRGPEAGAWLALAGAALMALAGLLSTARISLAIVTDSSDRANTGPGTQARTPERPTEPVDRD